MTSRFKIRMRRSRYVIFIIIRKNIIITVVIIVVVVVRIEDELVGACCDVVDAVMTGRHGGGRCGGRVAYRKAGRFHAVRE